MNTKDLIQKFEEMLEVLSEDERAAAVMDLSVKLDEKRKGEELAFEDACALAEEYANDLRQRAGFIKAKLNMPRKDTRMSDAEAGESRVPGELSKQTTEKSVRPQPQDGDKKDNYLNNVENLQRERLRKMSFALRVAAGIILVETIAIIVLLVIGSGGKSRPGGDTAYKLEADTETSTTALQQEPAEPSTTEP